MVDAVMAATDPRLALRARAIGAMIFATFGTAWMALWNFRAARDRVWVYLLVAVLGALLFLSARRCYRRCELANAREADTPERRRRERWFHIINAAQWLLILIVANVLLNIGEGARVLPAVVLIIGLHFLPLGRLFDYRGHYLTGCALMAAALLSDPIVCLAAGLILWASALAGLLVATARGDFLNES